jgi:hypothetical protein
MKQGMFLFNTNSSKCTHSCPMEFIEKNGTECSDAECFLSP